MPIVSKKELRQIGVGCLNFNLKKAAREIAAIYDRAFQALGIKSTQFSILVAIGYFTESPMSDLSAMLGLDRTTLSKNLKPLERDGYLTITPGADRRRHLVRLTQKGERLLLKAIPLRHQTHDAVVGQLGREDYRALITSLHHFDKKIRSKTTI